MESSPQPAHRLGILLSGRGSNFIAIADNVAAGKIPAEIAVVISNRPNAPGLQEAEQRGLSTGIVTTTTVTHATPAACYAHSPERRWESDALLPGKARQLGFPDIARQLLEFPHGDGLEVVLGGGRKHFLPRGSADPEFPRLRGLRLALRGGPGEGNPRRAGRAKETEGAQPHRLGALSVRPRQ